MAFDVGWLSQVLYPRHRIRVTVSGRGAPFYEINPGTGEPPTIAPPVKAVTAPNTVDRNR